MKPPARILRRHIGHGADFHRQPKVEAAPLNDDRAGHRDHHHGGAEAANSLARARLPESQRGFNKAAGEPRQHKAQPNNQPAFQQRQRSKLDDGEEYQQRPMPEIERVTDKPDPDRRPGGEYDAVYPGCGRGKQERRASNRQHGPPAWKRAGAVEDTGRDHDQRNADGSPKITRPAGLIDPAPPARQHRTGKQFKRAGERQIESRDRIGADQHHIEQERAHAEHGCDTQQVQPQPCGEHQDQRPGQVELLFDTERPQMQQRLFGGFEVEIAGLQQQRDVGGKGSARKNVAAEQRKRRRQHPQPSQNQRGGKHDDQGREYPPDPPVVEAEQTEAPKHEFARDDAGDQKTRDHEEDIDADEAAGQRQRKGVKDQNQHHRDGAEAIDIGPILRRRQGQGQRQLQANPGSRRTVGRGAPL